MQAKTMGTTPLSHDEYPDNIYAAFSHDSRGAA
jgi:hypothetical protein